LAGKNKKQFNCLSPCKYMKKLFEKTNFKKFKNELYSKAFTTEKRWLFFQRIYCRKIGICKQISNFTGREVVKIFSTVAIQT
jgi:hypothetical protein